jgi:hypothetical protein
MTAELLDAMRELDSRTNDGIHVRLLWCRRPGRVVVSVTDAKTGDAFTVEVREHDGAADVFHHPYAYAAWRAIETREVSRADQSAILAA